jgi:hypothetical protein
MADKRTTPESGASRRKRAAPTIDLTATEVPGAAAAASAPPPTSEADPPPPPPPEQPAPDTEPAPAAQATSPDVAPPSMFSAPAVAAGVAGAAAVTLVLFGLWLSGLVPIRYAGSTATRARVTALEMELHELQKRPPGAVDTQAIDALNGRVAKIEEAVGKISAGDPRLVERITAADNAMKALGLSLTALSRRSDDIAGNAAQALAQAEAAEKAVTELRTSLRDVAKDASAGPSSAELDALQKRIAGLEQSAKTAREEIAKAGVADTAARLVLSASSLRDAVLGGAPYAAALAQAKSLGADGKILAPLEPFAASGVPTPTALAQELRALLPGMIKTSGAQAPAGGFLERLQANAGQLVHIRPVDAPPGDDASAVLARVEVATAHADIGAALGELGKLPEAVRAPAQAWIKKAEARQAALAAARMFAAQSALALGKQ